MLTFKAGPKHSFSSRKFSIADMTSFNNGVFLSSDVVLEFSRVFLIHIYKATRFSHMWRVETEKRETERNSAKERKETDSVLFCDGLLWNISVTRIKPLID